MSNGQFQADENQDGWPDDWPRPEGSEWIKPEVGGPFVRLSVTKPGEMTMLYRQIPLPAPVPEALEFRVRARAVDLKPGKQAWFDGRIIAHFKSADGRALKPEPPVPALRGTSKDWVEKTYFAKVPAHARSLELMPCLFQAESGSVDFARVEVVGIPADRLPKRLTLSSSTVPMTEPSTPELHVEGNRLLTAEGKEVWLQGLCVPSLEWSAGGEKLDRSLPVAIDQWKANVIRLPVSEKFWSGNGPYQKKDGGDAYRKLVDTAVDACAKLGAWLVLDLHHFGAPKEEDIDFWKDAAMRYRNHPAVLFELFNEPHGTSWEVWRDGGDLMEKGKSPDDRPLPTGEVSVGMQALLDAVRSTGANNVVIAGGLDWGYDLSGIVRGFGLKDHPGGRGIVYSSHVYPWKTDWEGKTLAAAAVYPVFVGETGTPPDWSSFEFIPESARSENLASGDWPRDMLGLIQTHRLHWTAFSFHPKAAPMVIQDWDYTPTPYWGEFVKRALAGEAFELKRMR
ncbi:MAG: cellulase family glycosylhydrolase [Verrucomicrobiae bacterium]|nr:cellulase family glycosylhydrolase [Verrucomicrobiae bacterium]